MQVASSYTENKHTAITAGELKRGQNAVMVCFKKDSKNQWADMKINNPSTTLTAKQGNYFLKNDFDELLITYC